MSLKRRKIAVFCTDIVAIRAVNNAIRDHFEPSWARSEKGLQSLVSDDLFAAVIDKSPGVDAIALLQAIRKIQPRVRRVLLTENCDLSLIVNGLHSGAIEQIIYKPVNAIEVLTVLDASLISCHVNPAVVHPIRAAI